MAKTNGKKKLSYNLGFWQLFSIIVIAAALGGVVYFYAYGNIIQDDIDSVSFFGNPRNTEKTKTPAKKTLPKNY